MHSKIIFPLLVSLLSLGAAACSGATEPLPPSTESTGAVRFELRGISPTLPTTTSSGIRAGATFVVVAAGDFTKTLGARSADDGIVVVESSRVLCRCKPHKGDTRFVEVGESCAVTEERSCEVESYCRSKRVGDVLFEITDPFGGVVDRTTLHVRTAATVGYSIEPNPKESDVAAGENIGPLRMKQAPDGVWIVPLGERFKIRAEPIDANGVPLVCSENCAGYWTEDDEPLYRARGDFNTFYLARAKKLGQTTVTIIADDARREVIFRVVE